VTLALRSSSKCKLVILDMKWDPFEMMVLLHRMRRWKR
jgi:hypothetical protein